MGIASHIERIQEGLRKGSFISEAAVSQGILLPTLHELGWPVFNTSIVIPEFSLEGRRVDYALCHPVSRPAVFVEVKKVGLSQGADRQLFEYAFHLGVPMAILMDGQEWSFYLPGEQGRYDERRVYKLDLLERAIEETESKLDRYLSYKNVCSGDALKFARFDYQNVARDREIASNFPKAWGLLLKEQDSLLLDLLADKVEDLCGYKPDLDLCSQFLVQQVQIKFSHPAQTPKLEATQRIKKPIPASPDNLTIRIQNTETLTVIFKGKVFSMNSAIGVMTKVFQLLAEADSGFLERFASRKHGKKRRYLAKDRCELYPERLDLVEKSVEIVSGWWLGTNYSRLDIKKIIQLALEVAGSELSAAIQVNIE